MSKREEGNISIHLNVIDTPGYTDDTLKEWYDGVKGEVISRVTYGVMCSLNHHIKIISRSIRRS